MKKRLLAALLAFCMTVSLFPMQAMAAAAGNTSALGSLGIRQISSTAYSISPDVREYEWVLNNGALTQQMMPRDGGPGGRRLHGFHRRRLWRR